MSMHLHQPSLSLNGKRKGKVKFRNAEEAQKARELDASWKELQKRWEVDADAKKRRRAMEAAPLDYDVRIPAERSTAHIKSLDTGHKGAVSSPQIPRYTGSEILGIGQLHKSNGIPIFRKQDAEDLAKMRR